jgi:hypothetical protein
VQSDQANDFAVYYLAGRMYADGADPYGVAQPAWDQLAIREGIGHWEYPYRYPPPTAGVARLLLPFGPHDAAIAWGMLSAAALIGGALLLGHTLGGGKRTPVALLALLLWYPAYHTLQVGQVNAFVFAALVLALWALTRERFAAAGAALAVGVALKITPLALVAYLAWQRRWRSLPAAVASLAALCVVLLPLTGVHTYAAYLGRALRLTRQSDVLVSPGIDGVRSFFGRLLLPGTATTATPGGALVARLALGVVIGLVCVSAAALWRPRRRTHDAAADLDAAAAHAADAPLSPSTSLSWSRCPSSSLRSPSTTSTCSFSSLSPWSAVTCGHDFGEALSRSCWCWHSASTPTRSCGSSPDRSSSNTACGASSRCPSCWP